MKSVFAAFDAVVAVPFCLPPACSSVEARGIGRSIQPEVWSWFMVFAVVVGSRRTPIFTAQVSAHMGAVVCVRWSPDGSALCSCGEDGDVKVRQRTSVCVEVVVRGAAYV